MTQDELVAIADKKWKFFQDEMRQAGHIPSIISTAYTDFLALHLRNHNISSVTMEVNTAGQPILVPHPLVTNPTSFQIPKPIGIKQTILYYLCRSEYIRIRKAEDELKQLNEAFREYIRVKMPNPTAAVAARLGLNMPKGVRIISEQSN